MFLQQAQTLKTATREKNCCHFEYMHIALHLRMCVFMPLPACIVGVLTSVCSFRPIPAVLRNLIYVKIFAHLRASAMPIIMQACAQTAAVHWRSVRAINGIATESELLPIKSALYPVLQR